MIRELTDKVLVFVNKCLMRIVKSKMRVLLSEKSITDWKVEVKTLVILAANIRDLIKTARNSTREKKRSATT